MKLLIVDDEPIAVQGIVDGVDMDRLGFEEVFSAGSYAEAISVLSEHRIDLAICDIEMPDENGIALLEWINSHSSDTETIILSCHDEFHYARQAMHLRCLEYVLKPVRYEVLTEVLERVMKLIREKRRQNVMTEYGRQYIDSLKKEEPASAVDTVEKVAKYIDAHLDESLSVNALAGMAFMSADHLTRSFKRRYQKTVSEYILQKRIQLAKELLRDGRLTVTMVAGMVGFGSYSHFTEQFKKCEGITPREFQRREKGVRLEEEAKERML